MIKKPVLDSEDSYDKKYRLAKYLAAKLYVIAGALLMAGAIIVAVIHIYEDAVIARNEQIRQIAEQIAYDLNEQQEKNKPKGCE